MMTILPALMSARFFGDGGDVGHGISFLADGGGVAVLVVLIQPMSGILAACSIFSGFSRRKICFSAGRTARLG